MKHIFLDTTCFFKDPFLENSRNNRFLIQLSKDKIIKLYVSVVVIEELKRQLFFHFSTLEKEILSINKKYTVTSYNHKPDYEKILNRMENFFADKSVFTVVKFLNSEMILNSILNRNL
ncbi:hypothetical protein CH381_25345 [Leptospira sp. mixed culture ATI2-C-A1]|nr:hypothetical protein CH381_25345 [Leptospira sp. mixed culture ATI2-C-A1]